MSGKRSQVLDFIDQRGGACIPFAPLADGLFAASVAGCPWVGEMGFDEQFAAAEACGYHGCYVQGSTPDLSVNPALDLTVTLESETAEQRVYRQTIATPCGDLVRQSIDRHSEGITPIGNFVESSADLDAADAISQRVIDGEEDDRIRSTYSSFAERVRAADGVSQIQIELPYYLYGLPGFADGPLMMYMLEADRYGASMDLAEAALKHIAALLIDCGIDCLWFGASGTELLSPRIWEQVVIPQARSLVDHIRLAGGRSHFHCCGLSNTWIEARYYDQIGMDAVETLSPPASGDVPNLARARSLIDPAIVTRGNVDLGLIRTGTPSECAAAIAAVMDDTAGTPHIPAAADAILYGTPIENVQAMVDAVAERSALSA